jgi:hypothetical protein
VQRSLSKVVEKRICNGIRHKVSECLALEYGVLKHFLNRKNVGPKITMPYGNLLDIMFGLGLWYSFCAKKTL